MEKKLLVRFILILSVILFGIAFLMYSDTDAVPIITTDEADTHSFAVYTGDGDILYANKMNGIKKSIGGNVVVNTDLFTVNNPIGIIENPPFESILNIYGKVLKSLNNDKSILIIYIDGLGYELYKTAIASGNIPYMASLQPAAKALTVYPTITDAAFASMVTGESPKYTGIHSREKKTLPVPSIFDIASEKSKSSKVIEGNIKIIVDEVPTLLNIDENKNGTIDDEIYNCAMKEIQNPPHILLVHFHSYDDFGHKYGPGSKEALNQLGVLDFYIKNIMKKYKGDVIITSDHGMHDVEGNGEHGYFLSSDLYIPIIEINQAEEAGAL